MKKLMLIVSLVYPYQLQASDRTPPRDLGKALCDILDAYKPGSYHYFDCLDVNKKLAASASSALTTVRTICSASRHFYSFSNIEALRCFEDGLDLLIREESAPSPQALADL